MVSATLVLSTTAALAGSNALQPGGKGMHGMMGGSDPARMQAMSDCATKAADQMGQNGMMHSRMMAGGKNASRMMGGASPCSMPMGTSAEQLQTPPYTKR